MFFDDYVGKNTWWWQTNAEVEVIYQHPIGFFFSVRCDTQFPLVTPLNCILQIVNWKRLQNELYYPSTISIQTSICGVRHGNKIRFKSQFKVSSSCSFRPVRHILFILFSISFQLYHFCCHTKDCHADLWIPQRTLILARLLFRFSLIKLDLEITFSFCNYRIY